VAATIHVNDVGTEFRGTFVDENGDILDLSSATSVEMWFEKPAATEGDAPEVVERTATLVTDGTDGLAKYVTVASDLDRAGNWRVQGVAYFGASSPVHADVIKFKVLANLKAD
jgi:hypothetical protein